MAVANEFELSVEEDNIEEGTEMTENTEVQDTVEVTTKGIGRKRTRNPDKWKSKYARKTGLRKNSPRIELSQETECCHKKCLKQFSTDHLKRLREKFESLYYNEQNLYLACLNW